MPARRSELQKVRDIFANAEPEKALVWLEVITSDLKERKVIVKKQRAAKPKPVLQQAVG